MVARKEKNEMPKEKPHGKRDWAKEANDRLKRKCACVLAGGGGLEGVYVCREDAPGRGGGE